MLLVTPDAAARRTRRAAILIPVVSYRAKPSVLFTTRAATMNTQPSEVSFPGGHVEEGETFAEAALRECEEEVGGSHWSSMVIVGECSPLPSIKGTPVHPIVGVLPQELGDDLRSCLDPNPEEVENVFCISVEELLELETMKKIGRLSTPTPVFPSKHGEVWGLTAVALRPILHKVLKPVFLGKSS